ncbi:MAG: glycosyltransferase family 2 protein [Deltaproteobacteria bacterium]|nr:glycosyltransferase family 2 protein [Deltaproteobacteria bacterium]
MVKNYDFSGKLSVIMPVYNEAGTLLEIIRRVEAVELEKEIIIVDDGSTDGTTDIIERLPHGNIKRIYHRDNLGKGAAIRTAIPHVTGDVVVFQDADLEYDPREYLELIQPIADGFADAVFGSRLSGGRPQRVFMFWHLIGNRFLNLLTNILFNTTLSDMETCYKMMRTEILKGIPLKSDTFNIEPEITAKLLKRKLRIYEMPISYYGRTYGEGKKINWKHGIGAMWSLFRYRIFD